MADQTKIVLMGDLCADWFMKVPEYPQIGGDGLATEMYQEIGGSVSNTAIALAHLACLPILVTQVGNGANSAEILRKISQEGVETSRIRIDPTESTGVTLLIITPEGERTMFTYRGANRNLNPDEITPSLFAGAKTLHVSGYALLGESLQAKAVLKAIRIASGMNIPVSLDIGVEPAYTLGKTLTDLLPNIALLILGTDECCAIADEKKLDGAIKNLLNHGVGMLGLKLGKEGCKVITANQQIAVPGVQMPIIDTTGAGDAFSSGMIYGLNHGLTLEATGFLANMMGGIAVSKKGAGLNMPRISDLIDLLQKREGQFNPEITAEIRQFFHSDLSGNGQKNEPND